MVPKSTQGLKNSDLEGPGTSKMGSRTPKSLPKRAPELTRCGLREPKDLPGEPKSLPNQPKIDEKYAFEACC